LGGRKILKYKKSITILSFIIIILSLSAAVYGIFSSGGEGGYELESIHGNIVQIYGKGLYKNDSVSVVAQGIAQDIVTIFLGIPLLAISLKMFRRGKLKGKLLLAGTLGYFLYTYISYTFLWMYNPLFLVYVAVMSSSLFAFILTMMSFDMEKLSSYFNPKMPTGLLSSFLFGLGAIIGLMWLGMIFQPLMKGEVPAGLEHYTTLVIQAMDLGFVVPTAILSGVLLRKRKPFGYLLSSVVFIKGLTMGTALTAMIIGQLIAGVEIGIAMIVIFPAINLLMVYCMFVIMKNIREPKNGSVYMA
jgi:hypothetical protein